MRRAGAVNPLFPRCKTNRSNRGLTAPARLETRTTPMGIRQYKPVTAGRRGGSVSDFADLTDKNKKPEKSLLEPNRKTGGRNFQGKVCTRFRAGGHKQMYRVIDFKRLKDGMPAVVESIE